MTRERISFAVPEHLTTHNTTYLFPRLNRAITAESRTLSIRMDQIFIRSFFLSFYYIFRYSLLLGPLNAPRHVANVVQRGLKALQECERTLLRFRSGKGGKLAT